MRTRSLLPLAASLVLLLGVTSCGTDEAPSTDRAADQTAAESTSPTETTPTETSPAPNESPSEPTQAPTEAPAETPTDSPTDEASPPSPTETAPQLIAYAGGESPGVTVQNRADAQDLKGSPASFKKFAGDTAAKLVNESSCDSAAVGLTIEAVRTDGYAVGGVNECGGYQALWAIVDGQWKEIAGTQDTWDCKVLERYTVPSDIAGDSCYEYHGDHQEHPYHQG